MSEQGAILSAESLAVRLKWISENGNAQGIALCLEQISSSHVALAAQLATAQATIAEWHRQFGQARIRMDVAESKVDQCEDDLATERERRIASEGREGELGKALRKYGSHSTFKPRCDAWDGGYCDCGFEEFYKLAMPSLDRAGGTDGE